MLPGLVMSGSLGINGAVARSAWKNKL